MQVLPGNRLTRSHRGVGVDDGTDASKAGQDPQM